MRTDAPMCQSCSRPMNEDSDFGTKATGAPSSRYCSCCLRDGLWLEPDVTMQQLMARCVAIRVEHDLAEEQTAQDYFSTLFPNLERWRGRTGDTRPGPSPDPTSESPSQGLPC